VPIVLISGSLNFLGPCGPFQACNGIALPLPLPIHLCLLSGLIYSSLPTKILCTFLTFHVHVALAYNLNNNIYINNPHYTKQEPSYPRYNCTAEHSTTNQCARKNVMYDVIVTSLSAESRRSNSYFRHCSFSRDVRTKAGGVTW
jgi:hypothetical protein